MSAQEGSAQHSHPPKHPQVRVWPGVPREEEEGAGEETLPLQQLPRGFGTGEVGGGWPVTPPASSAPRAAGLLHLTYTPESPSSTAPSRVYQS